LARAKSAALRAVTPSDKKLRESILRLFLQTTTTYLHSPILDRRRIWDNRMGILDRDPNLAWELDRSFRWVLARGLRRPACWTGAGPARLCDLRGSVSPAQRGSCAAAGELDDSKGVGAAPEGDLSRQFLDFRRWPSPIKSFDVLTLALEDHLATLQASVEMLQH
jgi:hypothetical protein